MLNMKLFYQRIYTVHVCVVLALLFCTGVLNYLLWAYTPDTRFETLETWLLPFAKPAFSLCSLALAAALAADSHTIRVLRKLSYFKHK